LLWLIQTLIDLNLPTCCQNRIVEINRILKIGNAFQSILATGTLFNIFGPSPKKINSIVAVRQTDFNAFAQAMATIPSFTRDLARKECNYGTYKHIGNTKLLNFWNAMAETFYS